MRNEVALSMGRVAFGIGLVAVLSLTGCSDDLYSSCTPDEGTGCEGSNSCVSRPDFECSSRVCGRYKQSDYYCTETCTSDGDCPDGACRKYVIGTDERYCVPSNEL